MRKGWHTSVLLIMAFTAAGSLSTGAWSADAPADAAQASATEALQYPNAVRSSPVADIRDNADIEAINKGLRALAANKMDQARELLRPLADGDATDSQYIRARAWQGLAVAAMHDKDYDAAVDALEQALTHADVIPNKPYFDMQWALVRAHMAAKNWQQAYEVLQQWADEAGEKTADYYGIRGEIAYRQTKYADAITAFAKVDDDGLWSKHPSWSQMLARSYIQEKSYKDAIGLLQDFKHEKPDAAWADSYLLNAYLLNKQYVDAFDLLHSRYSDGTFTQSSDYVNLAKLYLMPDVAGDDANDTAQKAWKVLQDGLDNGSFKASTSYHELMATAARKAGDTGKAIEAYRAADEISDTGEAALQAGRLLSKDGQHEDARKMAERAISKGTRHQGQAWLLIANAAIHDDNRKAATTAMENAAKDPETEASATQWLEQQEKARQYTW